jgi:hypothetical protein
VLRRTATVEIGAFDSLLAVVFQRARQLNLIDRRPEAAIDSTGLEVRHRSRHYALRAGGSRLMWTSWPKLTVVCHTRTHLWAAAVASRGPSQDSSQFPEAMVQAGAHVRWDRLLAEIKNEVELDREEIQQDEAEQLSNSTNWFIKEYGKAAPVVLLMVHPTNDLSDSAYPPANTVVMTPKKLEVLHGRLRAFAAALSAKAPESWTTAEIGKLLASHQLDPGSIRTNYFVPTRK